MFSFGNEALHRIDLNYLGFGSRSVHISRRICAKSTRGFDETRVTRNSRGTYEKICEQLHVSPNSEDFTLENLRTEVRIYERFVKPDRDAGFTKRSQLIRTLDEAHGIVINNTEGVVK